MKKKYHYLFSVLLFVVVTLTLVFWSEAEKEVRILCAMIDEGDSYSSVEKLLETGTFISIQNEPSLFSFSSMVNLNTTACYLAFDEARMVLYKQYSQLFSLSKWAAITGTFALVLLTFFHLFLAFGLPLGEYGWGGKHRVLPFSFRLGSVLSALLLPIVGVAMLSTTRLILPDYQSESSYLVYGFTLLFALSVVGNTITSSKKEKKVMLPFSILLFGCFLIVTIFTL